MQLWLRCKCYYITLSCVWPSVHCVSTHWGSQRKMSTNCFPFSSIWSHPSGFWPFIMSSKCLVILLQLLAQLLMVLPGFSWRTSSPAVTACIHFHLNLRVLVLVECCRSLLLWKYIKAPGAVADAQDAFKGKYTPALACTIPSHYEHENLLLEIHTSVEVVITCQRVWGRGGSDGVVIFMAEQELDGGKETSFKKCSQDSGR